MKAKISTSWTSKEDLRDLLAMDSEAEEEVAGRTAVTIVMEIDAITMPVVVDEVVIMEMVMASEHANLEREACTDRAIGTASQSMTKRGAKLMNFVRRWIERLRNRWKMPLQKRITPRKFV